MGECKHCGSWIVRVVDHGYEHWVHRSASDGDHVRCYAATVATPKRGRRG